MPISTLLIGYALMSILYWIAIFFILYHLKRYSVNKDTGRNMTLILILGGIALFMISLLTVFRIDWSVHF